jgi:PAS domain-containing protein
MVVLYVTLSIFLYISIFLFIISIIGAFLYVKLFKKEGISNKKLLKLEKNISDLNSVDGYFLKSLPLPAWHKGIDGKMVWINEEYVNIFDVKKEDYIGHSDYDIWPSVLADEFRDNDNDIIKEGKAFIFMEKSVDKEGKESSLIVWKFPIKNVLGKIIGIGGICIMKDKMSFI